MPRRRRPRRSNRANSTWWMSGIYAAALAVGLVFILLFTGDSQESSFLYELFFAPPSSESTEQVKPEPVDAQPAVGVAEESESSSDAAESADGSGQERAPSASDSSDNRSEGTE